MVVSSSLALVLSTQVVCLGRPADAAEASRLCELQRRVARENAERLKVAEALTQEVEGNSARELAARRELEHQVEGLQQQLQALPDSGDSERGARWQR